MSEAITHLFFSSFLFSSPFVLYCFVFLCLVLSCIVLSCKAEIFKQYVYIIFHKFQIKYSSHCIEYSPAIIDSHIFRCPFWHQNHWYAVCIFEPPSIGKYFVFLHFHVSVVTRCVTIVQDRVNSVSFRNPMKHSATAAWANCYKTNARKTQVLFFDHRIVQKLRRNATNCTILYNKCTRIASALL